MASTNYQRPRISTKPEIIISRKIRALYLARLSKFLVELVKLPTVITHTY